MAHTVRRFIAHQYLNCSACQALIEPDDLMARFRPLTASGLRARELGDALCESCMQQFDDPDEEPDEWG